jgi:hypothetical protein
VRLGIVLAALVLALTLGVAGAAPAATKSRQCGTTVRHFGDNGFRFKVWVARGPTSCALAKKVMGRAFTATAVKGWKCIDATKGGGAPTSYSDECRKGTAIVRGDLLGKATAVARAAFTGRCQDVALTPNVDAKVVVRGDVCTRARALVRHWLAAGKADGQARRLRKVDGYVCVFGGDTLLRLRCTRDARVVRAEWGD